MSCLMLQSLNRLLARVRKKFIFLTSHSEISPEHSGNSLISRQHLERRLNIDLFRLLCFVQGDGFYIQGKCYLRIMKTFHIANCYTHPEKKLNPCPKFVQLHAKGKSKNAVIAAALLLLHHTKKCILQYHLHIVICLKRYTQVKADR